MRREIGDADITFVSRFEPLREDAEAAGPRPRVEICFRSIEHRKPDRGSLHRDDVFALTYRLRVVGPDPLANQHVLSRIYFSARENPDLEVEGLGAEEAGASRAVEAEPASLSIVARLVRPPKATPAAIVTQPLDVRLRALGRIEGKVVTEAGTPVMLARIDAPDLGKSVVSDTAGRFAIVGVPAAGTVALTVTARNKSVDVSVDVERETELVVVVPKESEHA
ncbi:MAG TPA: carboxypeptidase-like regulatory domain-containing protein [Gammaproteobacteria bacterium]